ncbi:hypothetical protein [Terrimonas pollutisoli]|uniref:hypothetical protein n=1 Tax=Terrimonas pollutisoli TaxID=3034147 RepID=UPI0023EC3EDF|nr:hypothetical protein [Terrimonas sp. H1YJ31]
MIKALIFLFNKWWLPVLFWIVAVGLVITSEIVRNNAFSIISLLLLGITLFGLLASTFFQLIKRRWLKGILTGLLFGGTIGAFVLYGFLLFFIETVNGDKWADNLQIPVNIQLADPIDLGMDSQRSDSILAISRTSTDLQLYNSFQPGLYKYDFWTDKIESGTIYLKAYEITQEYPLSKNRLAENSAIKIYNPTDSFMKFGTVSDFTIYEGDWGKPYAARFEVWYKSDSDKKERKLFEKNYKIEGWMR